eukprot:1737169-Rhodomonas_salina.2
MHPRLALLEGTITKYPPPPPPLLDPASVNALRALPLSSCRRGVSLRQLLSARQRCCLVKPRDSAAVLLLRALTT